MSETATWEGDWPVALQRAEQADRIAVQTGQGPIRAIALYAKSLAEAHLGRLDVARATARDGLELAEGSGSVVDMISNQGVLGFVQLSIDDPVGANGYLAPLVAWLDVVGIREPGVLRFIPDAIEALVGVGQLEKAEALQIVYEADATRLQRTWAMLAAARCLALITAAAGNARVAATELATRVEELGPLVPTFERARALYVLGAVRRRTRQRKASRESLEAALALFQSLGSEPWAAKASRLLGGGENLARQRGGQELTPAERRVARSVAAGATNREVASRLFVSVRAVELHLTNIYRKLGIASRTQLAVRMASSHAPARRTDHGRRNPGSPPVHQD
jgi:DNA-binding NarL/FixJ family response regulator